MAFTVPKEARDEYRRLVQRANRRIASAMKEYESAGRTIAPAEIVGDIQTRVQWASEKYAISRSTKFASESEYKKAMTYLRSFDLPNEKGGRPTITEYTKVQGRKIVSAVETATGADVGSKLAKKLTKMSAPDMSKFWDLFNQNALRKGVEYSSESVMGQSLQEFFNEDVESLVN